MIVIKVNYTTDAPIIKVNYDDAPIYISTTVDATYISVDYGSGAATNAVWGDITGTLSNQTDLQNALDAKVPYTGATANVNLGEYELKAGQLTLDTSPTGTASVGTTRWNDTIGSSETTLKGGSVILKNGVDLVARVVNKVTPNTTLTKAAYQAVRISGAQGQRLAVAFAQANNDNNSADTIGLVTETIATNQEGFIMTVGNLEDINTTGSLQGETWADGDVLYLSPTVAGAITNIKPVAPQHLVVIGYVEYAHANHGKIYVKIMNGWELGELHDVDTTGATAGQVLKYNGTIWTPSSDLDTGITSLNGLTALTQTFATGTSGTDFNISSATSTHTFNLPTASATNRGLVSSSDWSTFNAKIGGTLATGQVAFGSATNTIAGSNNLFWDNANGFLGIGTNAPLGALAIESTNAIFRIRESSGNAAFSSSIRILNSANSRSTLEYSQAAYTPVNRRKAAQLEISNNGAGGLVLTAASTDANSTIDFVTKSFASGAGSILQARITNDGNLLLNTTTDSGQRIQVQGDAFIKGSGNTSATTALTVQNSDAANAFRILNNGQINLGNNASSPLIRTVTEASITTQAIGGTKVLFVSQDTETGSTPQFNFRSNTLTHTTGNLTFFGLVRDYTPTSGTGTVTALSITGTINQTGGANGITRGLYVNPTLTAAADWRSIEWSNNSGWGIYGAGTSNNFIAGSLVIGNTTIAATNLRVAKTITGATVAYGMNQVGTVQSDVTTVAIGINNTVSTQAASFTLANYYHFGTDQGTIGAGSTVTNQYGFAASSTLIGATNNYGFYGNIPSGTNRWNLYCNGTAPNFMSGSLGIGNTSLTGFNLLITKNITGAAFSYGVYVKSANQTDVITTARIYTSLPSTQAAAFTLNTLSHFTASQGTIGATSSITNQYGFEAQSTLTGATNNYAFYGNIASGTGRWNFFANGTAANYLNGNTIIGGSAVDAGYKLDVQGTGRFSTGLYLTGPYTSSQYFNIGTGTGNAIFYWSSYRLSIGGVKIISEGIVGDPTGLATSTRASSAIDSKGYLVTDSIGIGTNTSTINTSAIAQVDSTTKGFLPPRMTTTQKNAIATPAAGLVVYDTTTNKLCCYNGTTWNDLF